MAEVGVKQLERELSRVIRAVERGTPVMVTKRGRPAAVILPIDEAEDFVLAHVPRFVDARLAGRKAHRAGRSVPPAEL